MKVGVVLNSNHAVAARSKILEEVARVCGIDTVDDATLTLYSMPAIIGWRVHNPTLRSLPNMSYSNMLIAEVFAINNSPHDDIVYFGQDPGLDIMCLFDAWVYVNLDTASFRLTVFREGQPEPKTYVLEISDVASE